MLNLKTIPVTDRLRNVIIAAAVALFAAMLVLFYVRSYKERVRTDEENVPVVVAAKEIPAGMLASEAAAKKLLRVEEVPRRAVVPGSFSNLEQVKTLAATNQIFPGEQVTAQRLRPRSQRGVRGELKGNMRAMQVPGDPHQLLVGTLKSGDRVDVVGSIEYRVQAPGGTLERVASRVVLRDIAVLRGPSSGSAVKVSGSDEATYVQLAVTDSQSQKLFYVMKNGDWTLQLRPATRAADSPESVETVESVLGDGLRRRQLAQLYGGGIR